MHVFRSNGSGVENADSNKPKMSGEATAQLLTEHVFETRLTTVGRKIEAGKSAPF